MRPAWIAPILCLQSAAVAAQTETTPESLVAGLSFEAYKARIAHLSDFGDRRTGSESFAAAARWVEDTLAEAGYEIGYHEYERGISTVDATVMARNIYVTKEGLSSPHEMLIVSAHLDGIGGGGGADDDASGVALLIEAALAFAPAEIRTAQSIRFIFWNGEETGYEGSLAYAGDRFGLQGLELPVGSGRYPEPAWLGIVQHDMLLYDHGLPPGPVQIADADIDIEYRAESDLGLESLALAEFWLDGNLTFSSDYPAEIGDEMSATDSVSFMTRIPSISIRENRRLAEIGRGANPNWHRPSDVYASYSEADFRLGFNALQMTVGSIARFVGLAESGSPAEKATDTIRPFRLEPN